MAPSEAAESSSLAVLQPIVVGPSTLTKPTSAPMYLREIIASILFPLLAQVRGVNLLLPRTSERVHVSVDRGEGRVVRARSWIRFRCGAVGAIPRIESRRFACARVARRDIRRIAGRVVGVLEHDPVELVDH